MALVVMSQATDFVEWVESATIQVTGGEGHDRWRFKIPLKLHSQGRNIDRAVIGQRHLDDGIGADAEMTNCAS